MVDIFWFSQQLLAVDNKLHTNAVLLSRPFFRSRDQDRDLHKMNSSLETMVWKSHHWLHQFQLVTEDSHKGATNYGNRATGVGTKHAVLRPRPRPWTSGLETETVTWVTFNKMKVDAITKDHNVSQQYCVAFPVIEGPLFSTVKHQRA